MKTMGFADVRSADYTLTDIAVFYVKTPRGRRTVRDEPQGRINSGFVYTLSGSFEYVSENNAGDFHARGGQIVYLPKYSRYRHTADHEEPLEFSETIVVNFNCRDSLGEELLFGGAPCLLEGVNSAALRHYFEELYQRYYGGGRPAELKILLYSIMSRLCDELEAAGRDDKRLSLILPAVEYIERENVTRITVKELAAMCWLGENAFRGIFRAYYGMLPGEFLVRRKLEKAKHLLTNTDLTVNEIAEALLFGDPACFCKTFKRFFGVSPGKYRR